MYRRHPILDSSFQFLRRVVAHPWFEGLARLGFVVKGTLYFVIGLLAGKAALGARNETTDTNGALKIIVSQPFGQVLLVLITIGIVGYVLWRLTQVLLNPEYPYKKLDLSQILQRLGYGSSGIAYSGLAISAVKLILGADDKQNSAQDWTALLLAQPYGQWLVGLGGLVVLGVGLGFFMQASKSTFQCRFNLAQMSQLEQQWAKPLGRFGVGARGVVFSMVGLFLIQAAIQSDPQAAKGLGDTLTVLAQSPLGPVLLGIVALGLLAYSLYSLVEARYRQIVYPPHILTKWR